MEYLASDEMMRVCRHAATVARFRYLGPERGMVPKSDEPTATLSLIKIDGRTYAVTAHHVIRTFDENAVQEGNFPEGYFILQKPGAVVGPFIRPPKYFSYPAPDIAICPISEDLPPRLQKEAFEVTPSGDANWPVRYAIAVGFPTSEKFDRPDLQRATRLALPCVHAVAEGLESDGTSDQVQFHSEIEARPNISSLSGMSGGPVFWSDGEKHGLIGFVKEALDVTPKQGESSFYTEPKVNFICQRVDYNLLKGWTEYADRNWQRERDKVNAAIGQTRP